MTERFIPDRIQVLISSISARRGVRWLAGGLLMLTMLWWSGPVQAGDMPVLGDWPWWVVPIALFALTFVLGIVAVLAGVGGGVLFVPIVSGFAPFIHIDFVRGAGLFIALAGALSAGPKLVRENLVNVRLAIPVCLVASVGSIVGALIGLALPEAYVQIALGVVILVMAVVMNVFRPQEGEAHVKPDALASLLGIENEMVDPVTGRTYLWRPKSIILGLVLSFVVGIMAGMFGLGAGWANVPVFNLVMGLPLKYAVASSFFLLGITGPSASLIYFSHGALLPFVVIPSVLGIVLGAQIGAKLLVRANTTVIRRVVTGVLVLAGARALLRGFGI